MKGGFGGEGFCYACLQCSRTTSAAIDNIQELNPFSSLILPPRGETVEERSVIGHTGLRINPLAARKI